MTRPTSARGSFPYRPVDDGGIEHVGWVDVPQDGRVGSAETGSHPTDHAPQAGHGASRFDPAREALTEVETQVYFLLRKYRVQKHYRASSAAKVTRYAVYVHGSGQITEPAPYIEAQSAADRLTAKDVAATILAACDRDGAEGGDANAAPVPQDRQARAEGIAQERGS